MQTSEILQEQSDQSLQCFLFQLHLLVHYSKVESLSLSFLVFKFSKVLGCPNVKDFLSLILAFHLLYSRISCSNFSLYM